MSHTYVDVDPSSSSRPVKPSFSIDRNVLLLSSEYLEFEDATKASAVTASPLQRFYRVFIRVHTATSLIAAVLLSLNLLRISHSPSYLYLFTVFVLLAEVLTIIVCIALYFTLKLIRKLLRVSLINIGYLPMIYSIFRYAVHFLIIFSCVKFLSEGWGYHPWNAECVFFAYEIFASSFIIVRNLILGICSKSGWDSHLLEMEPQTFDVDESYIREIKKEVKQEIQKFKNLNKGIEDPKYIEMMKIQHDMASNYQKA